MYTAELLTGDHIEIYAESTRILLYIFGLSLAIAVFGSVMNRINIALSVRSKEKSYQQQSMVFMNQRSHEVKGYNGGSYHIDFVNENNIVNNAGVENLARLLLKLSFRSLEGRLREVERWRKGKFIDAMLKESLDIVIKRIDKNIRSTEDEIILHDKHGEQEFTQTLKHLNDAVAFGELEKIDTLIVEALPELRKVAGDKSEIQELEVELYRNAAAKFLVFCQLEKAVEYLELASEKQREISGALSETFAECLNELGYVHHLSDHHDKAITCHENALLVYTRTIGPERLEVGITHNALGISQAANGNYEKALKHHFYALPILTKNFGATYPSVAATHCNIALALCGSNQHQRAIEQYRQAIEIDQAHFGKHHKSIAIYCNLLGLAYYQLQELEEAISSFKKALEVAEKVYGTEHPTVATISNNLGGVLYATEAYDEAIKYYERALGINLQIFDKEHEIIGINLGNLGSAWKKKGNFIKAIDYYQNALTIEVARYGEMHPTVATTYDNLGGALRGKGEYEKALDYKKKALDINIKLLGEEHRNVAICYNGIGKTYEAMDKFSAAIENYQKALAINKKIHGDKDINVARVSANLGRAYALDQQNEAAEKFCEIAVEIYKSLPGQIEKATDIYGNMSDIFSSKEAPKKALQYAEKAYRLFADSEIKNDALDKQLRARVEIMKERLAVS